MLIKLVSMMRRPQRPRLRQELFATLETRGVDSIRAMLVHHTGAGPQSSVPLLMHPDPPRAEVEAWLNWKAAIESWRIRVTVLVGIVSAVAATVAAILAGLSWRYPVH
jgi:hypothetical protein